MSSSRIGPGLRERLGGLGWRRIALIRRLVAAALAALALVLALTPDEGTAGVPLVVATADIGAGATLRGTDLAVAFWPERLVPAGALSEPASAEGRVLIGAARAGEALTDVRVVGAGDAVAAGPGGAAVPVRLADAGVAALLLPGSRVDVVTIGERTDQPVVLAADATVLAVLPEDKGSRGRLVMVAMPRTTATQVAAATLTDQVAVTLR